MDDKYAKEVHSSANYFSESFEKENSIKSFTVEPEMEDFNDTFLLKNLIKELNIEEYLSSEVDPLKHDSLSPATCVHCKLLKKLTGLQNDITKMNQEICATHEILNIKKEQNNELKNMIKRLEASLGKSEGNYNILEKSQENCSCMNKCLTI